jgi:ABC-2 type transport system ATP-binding protein
VLVRTRSGERLTAALRNAGATVAAATTTELHVDGLDSEAVGAIAAREGVALIELTTRQASLEDAFMELTGETVEYQGSTQVGA